MSKKKKELSIIEETTKEFTELIDNTEDITELLQVWQEIAKGRKSIEEINERIRTKIKNYLKERQWERYMDKKLKIGITLIKQSRERLDKEQLKMMLTEAQISQVISISTFERLNIITPERRKELSKIVRK